MPFSPQSIEHTEARINTMRLQAAAPDLLAVLKTTKFALDSVYHITGNDKLLPYIEEAEAVIAKATGE